MFVKRKFIPGCWLYSQYILIYELLSKCGKILLLINKRKWILFDRGSRAEHIPEMIYSESVWEASELYLPLRWKRRNASEEELWDCPVPPAVRVDLLRVIDWQRSRQKQKSPDGLTEALLCMPGEVAFERGRGRGNSWECYFQHHQNTYLYISITSLNSFNLSS